MKYLHLKGKRQMDTITENDIKEAIDAVVQDIIEDFESKPDTDREELIERMDEECDTMFGQLVQHGLISDYDEDDLVRTAQPCAAIIQYAKKHAWVEDDRGLWEGLTYGIAASIAFFSLRNCLYKALADAGHDSNEEYPFAKEPMDERELRDSQSDD